MELDQFFKVVNHKKDASQYITKSAFFQARKQLSHTAFIDLNHQLIEGVYENGSYYKTWKGFRLCAIDGTSIRLPNEPDIIDYFGVQKGKPNQADCTLGMASVFYDVLNHTVIDASINPNHTSEKQCAAAHLNYAGQHDLIIYDRGYPAFWLYALHIKHQHVFCVREKTRQSDLVKSFILSKKKQAIVTFKPNKSSKKTCREKGLSITPIKLRLVRVDLASGVEVLVTNLIDTHQYDVSVFKSLYHLRWGIEENYKRLKQWVEIENFSGKSALSVKQDFYAKIVAINLTALMAMAAEKTIIKNTRHRKLKYQINFAQALSKMKHRIVCLILQAHNDILGQIEQTIRYISTTIESVRLGRAAPRRLRNMKNDIHFPAYKSAL
ncbi:hypothetical protein MNBD_GAMMA12-2002 [hydrothermal vent metagenome]|uniref:Transposase IS4-like domain-containing protein n=1 Tax=hydrothermal vent metagenome TaxID=652676 RepID=A0A3B0Y448_9ZZZZ